MNRHYEISLPLGGKVDIFNLPDNFEECVINAFSKYTEGTHKDYTYQDKLSYIDHFVEKLVDYRDDSEEVDKLVKEKFDYEWKDKKVCYANRY